jgi:hypothetical protein
MKDRGMEEKDEDEDEVNIHQSNLEQLQVNQLP